MTYNLGKSLLLLLGFVAIAAYTDRTLRVFLAERLVATRESKALERASSLVPDNPEFHRLLGLQQIVGEQNYGTGIGTCAKLWSLTRITRGHG